MKICFFSHGSGTNQDGASLSMLNVMEELTDRGHKCVAIMVKDVNLDHWKKNPNIKFFFIPTYDMRLSVKRKGVAVDLKYTVKNCLNNIKALSICKLLKSENIDLVHINGINNGIGAIVAKKFGVPYVWHIRQLMEEDLGQRLFNKRQVWPLIKNADAVIAIANVVRDKFEKEFGRSIVTVYNGVPIEDYLVESHSVFEDETISMLLPGRITAGKGQLDAVMAVEALVKAGEFPVVLHLAGHGQDDYADKVRNYIADHELKDNVIIHDHISDLRKIRSECDIGLTCSKKEAFGRVTVENQLAGMLAIGANTGGTVEIIQDGVNGLLYKEGDPYSLAGVITKACSDRDKMRKIAAFSREEAKTKYSICRVVDEIEQVYHTVKS